MYWNCARDSGGVRGDADILGSNDIHLLKPKEIKAFLNLCVCDRTEAAKKVFSVAVYNHYARAVTSLQAYDVDVQRQQYPG